MVELFIDWGIDLVWLVKGVFEVNMLFFFGICLVYLLCIYGWCCIFCEFVGGFLLIVLCEFVGVLLGVYVYFGFEFYILVMLVVNFVGWVVLVYIIMILIDCFVFG